MRVAGERSLTRSDTRRASLTSHSSPSPSNPTRPETLPGGTALTAVLRARFRRRSLPFLRGKGRTDVKGVRRRAVENNGYALAAPWGLQMSAKAVSSVVVCADLAGEIPHVVPALSCPDLQDLITRFGGYDDKIPAEAWKQVDRNIAAYRRQLRSLAVTGVSKPTASNPYKLYPASEECCLCYQRGAFGYRKQTLARFGRLALLSESTCAGDLIWFCHQHKPANDFADARRGTP
jgi:hypothetical protein